LNTPSTNKSQNSLHTINAVSKDMFLKGILL